MLDIDVSNDFCPEDFVTCFHVREIHIGEHVGQNSQELVPYIVPEQMDPMRPLTKETGTKNHVGFSFYNGCHQFWIFIGVVFQVGILDNNRISGNMAKARPDSRPFTHIHIMVHYFIHFSFKASFDDLRGTVIRAIIYQDDFLFLNRGGFDKGNEMRQ